MQLPSGHAVPISETEGVRKLRPVSFDVDLAPFDDATPCIPMSLLATSSECRAIIPSARSLTVCEGQEGPTASALTHLAAPQGQHQVPDTRQQVKHVEGEASAVLLCWYAVNVQRQRMNVFTFGRSLGQGVLGVRLYPLFSFVRGFDAVQKARASPSPPRRFLSINV